MEEEKQLPLARMVTINKPSFWIFLAACITLFICEWIITDNTFRADRSEWNQMILLLVVFTGLTLNIIATRIKDEAFERNFMLYTYFFEIAGVLAAAFMIFLPR